ncbi:MAG TPA: helix-turn-helix domain-containing protein [Pseudonocardiaceae bacterium]|nr:helix-turn-helix domain-containing protein [Pseudonocardiaceae bacterium]
MTSDEPPSGTSGRRPASRAEAAALASAVRLRIIRLTAKRPLTNKEIAQRLGKDPATTLYHVRKLVATGFLVAQPERSGARGSKEIPYLGTMLSWRLTEKPGYEDEIGEAMLSAFLGEVADIGIAELEQTRLVTQLDEAGLAEFTRRVQDLMDEFAARPKKSGSQEVGIYVAWYPSR